MKMLHIVKKYVPYFALQKSQFYMCHDDTQAQVCSTGKTGRPVLRAFRVLGTAPYSPRYAIKVQKSNPWQRVASGGCPACDIISNVWKGVHAVLHSRVHHIPGVYKRLRPNPGESFCSSGHQST